MMHTLLFLVLGFLTVACGAQSVSDSDGTGNGTDSNTHWLSRCQEDSDCEGGLSCLCGVCSETCSGDSACNAFTDDAVCSAVSCAESGGQAVALCTLACTESSDCPSDAECAEVCIGSDATVEGEITESDASGADTAAESDVNTENNTTAESDANTETDPGTVVNACAPMDARSSGDDCVKLEGFAWNGGVCETVNCGCVGADCDDIYPDCVACYEARAECLNGAEIPAECVATTPEPDQCAPMDAQSSDLDCLSLTGFAWDGDSCEGLLCGCAGSDCGDIYIDCSTCYAAHTECLSGAEIPTECVTTTPPPDECAPMDVASTDGNCADFTGYAWDGSSCQAVTYCGCVGADCDRVFPALESCEAAYLACTPECTSNRFPLGQPPDSYPTVTFSYTVSLIDASVEMPDLSQWIPVSWVEMLDLPVLPGNCPQIDGFESDCPYPRRVVLEWVGIGTIDVDLTLHWDSIGTPWHPEAMEVRITGGEFMLRDSATQLPLMYVVSDRVGALSREFSPLVFSNGAPFCRGPLPESGDQCMSLLVSRHLVVASPSEDLVVEPLRTVSLTLDDAGTAANYVLTVSRMLAGTKAYPDALDCPITFAEDNAFSLVRTAPALVAD